MPFQVTNCATLKFKPKFAVSTPGKTSRTNGTSLAVKLTYPVEEGQANIAKVKVELPKQLPSRLPTLQKACTEAAFDANPESCPAASKVGEAIATTPTISGTFTGPAYFVRHGGAAWPELIVVLQGRGRRHGRSARRNVHQQTGVTSSTFNTVPDVPVGSFELKLPAGQYSALTANGANLCGKSLTMPTEFVAQNGVKLTQNTKIAVTGCPKAKKAHTKAAHKKKRGRGAHGKGKRANRRARAGRGAVIAVPSRARGGGADRGRGAGHDVACRPAHGDVDRGGGRGGVAEIQRARMIAALVEVARERGASGVTVAHIVARSGVSRRTFYELFEDREDCFLAGFDLAVQGAARRVLPAYGVRGTWRERVRAGLGALLEYLDDEPGMGALCVVDALGAGPVALERRSEVVRVLIDVVHEGRKEARGCGEADAADGGGRGRRGAGGVARAAGGRRRAGEWRPGKWRTGGWGARGRCPGGRWAGGRCARERRPGGRPVGRRPRGRQAGEWRPADGTCSARLMGMIVLPYLGKAAAARETSRPAARRKPPTPPSGDPLRELDMRLTYRTVQVLLAIAALGGRGPGPSNRQVAEAAGVADPGQISKLLARLEHLGLIENEGGPPAPGEPHVWRLTPKGAEIERTIRRQTTPADG